MISRITAAALLAAGSFAHAQHDPQRDASRHVADGRLDQAEKVLKKGDQNAPETHFLRMMIELQRDDMNAAIKHAQAALDAGLAFSRLVVGPRELLEKLHTTEQFKKWSRELPNPVLVHGPMIGSVTDDGASFWVRTSRPAKVEIRVAGAKPQSARTMEASDYTMVIRVGDLKAATTYHYQVYVDGKSAAAENTRFKTFPKQGAKARFSVGFGGGAGYIPEWERMWDNILTFKPIAMFMLGDNVYIDQPEKTLTQYYCYYRRQSRPEWRRLVAGTAMFSIYDDHDFGVNDCVPGPDIEKPKWKREVWNVFRQNWVNPGYGGGEKQPGCWYDTHIGDVHFIFLDGRYYRNLKGGSMIGPVQKRWLFDTLKNSKGTFKVVASPVPWTAGVKPGSRDPWDGFPKEREEIYSYIEQNRINGVFLIAADRHRTDLRVTKRANGYDLYEFESSRLTNRHTHGVVKTEGMIWGYNKQCSFGLMSFDTTARDPQVKFEAINIDGERIHEHVLKLSEISR